MYIRLDLRVSLDRKIILPFGRVYLQKLKLRKRSYHQ